MKLIVNNLAIEYQDEGKGKILLLLHGWGDTLHTYDRLTSSLKNNWRIVRLDLPYFGQSESPKETWKLDNYVELVSAFIKKLKLEPYALIGHSFGGRISIKGTGNKIFNEKKLILIGSAGLAKRKTLKNTLITVIAKIFSILTYLPPLVFWREKIKKRAYEILGSDYYSAGDMKETFINIISEELSESAKKVKVPTLLIWGQDDTETPLEQARKIKGLIEGSKLAVIQNAGHMVHQQKTDEVASLIKEFL